MSVFAGIKLPQVLLETSSEYNKNIKVLQSGDVRKLSVNNYVQSLSKNSKSAPKLCWGETTKLLKKADEDFQNILILGMGGATMQHFICDEFPDSNMVSVEIDPVIVDIARDYFDLESIPNHRVIVDDAFRVVVEPSTYGLEKQSFDAIVVDLVFGEDFPDLLSSGNFLSALKALGVPGGLVIFNRMYLEGHQEGADAFTELLANFFDDIQTHTIAGYTNSDNILIYGRI
jgi:spermidine synthase